MLVVDIAQEQEQRRILWDEVGGTMSAAPAAIMALMLLTACRPVTPYIMWDGTPYEHLMIPVADMDMHDMATK